MDGAIQITERRLFSLLADAAELGARRAVERAGIAPAQMSLRQSYRLYGRPRVSQWIKAGYVKPVYNNNKYLLNVSELDAASKTDELTAKTLVYGNSSTLENGGAL